MTTQSNTISLPVPKIFSFSECLHFLDRGYDDCLYSIEDEVVKKPLRINGEEVLLKISRSRGGLEVKLNARDYNQQLVEKAAKYVTEWFDLERSLQPFYDLLRRHNQLSWMSKRFYGLRLMGIPDLFEALCWCVVGQQINLTFAHKLKRRLVERYGTFITCEGQRHYLFPEPEVLAQCTVDKLREMQFSRRKSEYIIGIAQQFAEGKLEKASLKNLSDRQQKLDRLTDIRGVGEWTANYVLMKSLQDSCCITYGDTGLQSAVSTILELNQKPSRKEVEKLFAPFAGWETYLNIYLWRTLS